MLVSPRVMGFALGVFDGMHLSPCVLLCGWVEPHIYAGHNQAHTRRLEMGMLSPGHFRPTTMIPSCCYMGAAGCGQLRVCHHQDWYVGGRVRLWLCTDRLCSVITIIPRGTPCICITTCTLQSLPQQHGLQVMLLCCCWRC